MHPILRKGIRFILYLGVGVGILWAVYVRQEKAYQAKCVLDGLNADQCRLFDKIMVDFGRTDWFWITIVLLMFLISNVSRTIRWQLLLEPLGIRPGFTTGFFSIMIGYFANLGLPRVGEVVRAATLARYEKAPTQNVMGTVVVDRMLDMISMLIVIGLAILLDGKRILGYLTQNADFSSVGNLLGSIYVWMVIIVGGGALYSLYRYRDRLARYPLVHRIIEILRGFKEGLMTVGKVRRLGWFIFHSLAIWVLYYLMTYVCFFAYEQTAGLSPVAGLTTFVFGTFGMLIPAPGGMGTYQFLVSEALVMYGIPGEDGFSFSMIVFFAIQIFCNILFGLLGLILLPILHRRRPSAGIINEV